MINIEQKFARLTIKGFDRDVECIRQSNGALYPVDMCIPMVLDCHPERIIVYGEVGLCECRCDCGKLLQVSLDDLQLQVITECGKCWEGHSVFPNKQVGWLTVIEPTNLTYHKSGMWECRCRCGAMTIVDSSSLQQGNTRSCGCMGDASRMIGKNKNITVDDIPIGLIKANQLRCQINKELQRN